MTEWEKVIPKPKSAFLKVRCPKCDNEQILFSHAANKVYCNICKFELTEPTGGKALIKGDIRTVFE